MPEFLVTLRYEVRRDGLLEEYIDAETEDDAIEEAETRLWADEGGAADVYDVEVTEIEH